MSTAPQNTEPLLRTLSPALQRIDQQLRAWMDAPRHRSLSTLTQASLDGLSTDLRRKASALDVERPLLVIMLMGGTGVGKSTLLNALARGAVAEASFTRPTTRAPVVYFHESIRPDRLDPALQQCRLVAHDRAALEHKILVDTPDLDSNEPANREKLKQVLPVADVVLYVGSQEKYHDKLGWELFLEHRKRRAFAFVLNKWDRCLHGVTNNGLRPDEDLLRDLNDEGFNNPLLFRTCAQAWVEMNGQPPQLPEGEQFRDLEQWLEMGLTRLEIEAIKARGVSQLLDQLEGALETAKPPDLREVAARTEKAWDRSLEDEAENMANVLLATIDPHQREIEQHFSLEGHRRFRGMMAGFLHLTTRVRYLGSSIRKQLPRPLRGDLAEAADSTTWDLAAFSRLCSGLASDRHLDARTRALPNHLLVVADQEGYPVPLLSDATEEVARKDWRQRFATVLIEVLHETERQWAHPTGPRSWVQTTLVWLGDLLPMLAILGSSVFLLDQYFSFSGYYQPRAPSWSDLLLPLASVLAVLTILYVLTVFLLPIRWPGIRGTFHRELAKRLEEELSNAYLSIPKDLADELAQERRQIDKLIAACKEVAAWLREKERGTTIEGLYGD
jgi:hypothetical protein